MPEDREPRAAGPVEPQSPADNVGNILEEARMILPGVQTLFGFQLIVVFNGTFHDRLSETERYAHLVAMALVAISTAMLIAPAAYHRQAEPQEASTRLVHLASRLLTWSTLPLAVALCLDFYLVATLITEHAATSVALALALFVVFTWLWYAIPHRRRPSRDREGNR